MFVLISQTLTMDSYYLTFHKPSQEEKYIEFHGSQYLVDTKWEKRKKKTKFIKTKKIFIVAFACFVFNNKFLRGIYPKYLHNTEQLLVS